MMIVILLFLNKNLQLCPCQTPFPHRTTVLKPKKYTQSPYDFIYLTCLSILVEPLYHCHPFNNDNIDYQYDNYKERMRTNEASVVILDKHR